MKRSRRRRTPRPPQARNPRLTEQIRCSDCGRWHLKIEACWWCHPAWPDPCLCAATVIAYVVAGVERFLPHLHLDHKLLLHISQVMYESIDETILLPADWMPDSGDEVLDPADEELHGVAAVPVQLTREESSLRAGEGVFDDVYQEPAAVDKPTWRRHSGPWWEEPGLRARMARFPELRSIARQDGIDGIFRWAGFTDREADAYSLDAAGYVVEGPGGIADRLRLKPGGVENLLAAARGKVAAALARMERKSA